MNYYRVARHATIEERLALAFVAYILHMWGLAKRRPLVTYRKVGGIHFVKVVRLNVSFSVSKRRV